LKLLALETSAKSVSAAVTQDGVLLAESFQCTGLTHSRTLLPMVDALLKNAELSLDSIDGFAVAAGPGSFTGLRIGVSALKGLAWTLEKPCVGISTLEAMAYNLLCAEGLIVCAMDARRNQVYNALFAVHGGVLERLCPDRAIGLDELHASLRGETRPIFVLGDGAALAHGYLTQQGVRCTLAPAALRYQRASGVALAAEAAFARGEGVSAQDLRPVYLRVSQAERERAARLAQTAQDQHSL